jgi:serine/threonine-protein kinase
MPLGARVWKFGRFLLLVAALGATFFVFFGLALRVALRAREVQVPTLTGHTVNEATRTAAERGLGLRVDENRRNSNDVPAGRIMAQDPQAGVQARRQRTVRVWVSAGPVTTTVPAVQGQSERTALLRLDQEGLTVAAVAEIRSADYPADTVVAQDPPARVQAPRVSLLVNRGAPVATYVMPDAVGVDAVRAADFFRSQGFRVTVAPGAAPGTVVRQTPPAGAPVAQTDPITFEVSH